MEVADTGRGIPKSQLSKIFNYYYTSKPKGTGLGLTISQQIIQQHNGSISVESEEGKGTRFIISLPLIA
jgi:signal transduction histidine kinase